MPMHHHQSAERLESFQCDREFFFARACNRLSICLCHRPRFGLATSLCAGAGVPIHCCVGVPSPLRECLFVGVCLCYRRCATEGSSECVFVTQYHTVQRYSRLC